MWTLDKNKYEVEAICVNESLFALGNGQIGVRGCFEEQLSPSIRGTYINGFYDLISVEYGERLYGFPEESERQVNVVETQTLLITLDDEKISLSETVIEDFNQSLKMKDGYAHRHYKYKTSSGKTAKISFKRMVSFVESSLFLINLDIEYDGRIKVESFVDGDITTYSDDDDPRVGSHKERLLEVDRIGVEEDIVQLKVLTKRSNLELTVHSTLLLNDDANHAVIEHSVSEAVVLSTVTASGYVSLTKYNVYTAGEKGSGTASDSKAVLDRVIKKNFSTHLEDQKHYMKQLWSSADIQIHGDDKAQQAVRYNLFQLFQSIGRDGKTNISAKGLTGEGYEGHTFWDTEIYILPIILMTQPEMAKSLLTYRYGLLSASKERAHILGHKQGVKFPWRTIKGRECSSYFPAGTAQYHINGDVAYSFIQYYLTTGDMDFMLSHGFEVLMETSRLWLDIGHFYEDTFRIDAVTGPDEYSCIVNNNFYTNSLAKYGLQWTVKMSQLLQSENPLAYTELVARLGVGESELTEFEKAADLMFLPYDASHNIHCQDDHFMQKKQWDFEGTPRDKYPLLLHYHPLTIYRHQVIKQADTVLAHFLLEDEMPEDVVRDSFHYYEKITTHDSSLSSCVYGIMAAKLGEYEKAWELTEDALYLDLENLHHNTKDGLHMANLGGSIMAILYGFMGYKQTEGEVKIAPYKPAKWSEISFTIKHNQSLIDVTVGDEITLSNRDKEPVTIKVYDTLHTIEESVTLALIK